MRLSAAVVRSQLRTAAAAAGWVAGRVRADAAGASSWAVLAGLVKGGLSLADGLVNFPADQVARQEGRGAVPLWHLDAAGAFSAWWTGRTGMTPGTPDGALMSATSVSAQIGAAAASVFTGAGGAADLGAAADAAGSGSLVSSLEDSTEATTSTAAEGGIADSGTIAARSVRFTQDSIGQAFKGGKGSVMQMGQDLANGDVAASDLPPIRVFEQDGGLYSLDNRRLFAGQMANVDLPYTMATQSELDSELPWKFTEPFSSWS